MAVLCVVLNKTLQERKWFWTARAWAGDPSPEQCQPGQLLAQALAQEGEEAPATNRTPVCSLWVLAPRMWPDGELPLGWLFCTVNIRCMILVVPYNSPVGSLLQSEVF